MEGGLLVGGQRFQLVGDGDPWITSLSWGLATAVRQRAAKGRGGGVEPLPETRGELSPMEKSIEHNRGEASRIL